MMSASNIPKTNNLNTTTMPPTLANIPASDVNSGPISAALCSGLATKDFNPAESLATEALDTSLTSSHNSSVTVPMPIKHSHIGDGPLVDPNFQTKSSSSSISDDVSLGTSSSSLISKSADHASDKSQPTVPTAPCPLPLD